MNKVSIFSGAVGVLIGAGIVSAVLIPRYQADRTASLAQEKRVTAALTALKDSVESIPAYRLELLVPTTGPQEVCSKVDARAEARAQLALMEEELKELLKQPSSPLRRVW